MPLVLVSLCLAGCVSLFGETQDSDSSARTEVRLLISASEAKPGNTVMVGVLFTMPEPWHIYWRNGGDAGQPPEIKWQLPEGITAGPLHWPTPQKYPFAQVSAAYVYHQQVMLLAQLHLSKDISSGKKLISGEVSWLECNEGCIFGEKKVVRKLMAGNKERLTQEAKSLRAWYSRLPSAKPPTGLTARLMGQAEDVERTLRIELPAKKGAVFDFYSYQSSQHTVGTQTGRAVHQGKMRLDKKVKKLAGNWPGQIKGLLVELSAGKPNQSWEVELKLGCPGKDK
jgi:thiol:disulfide interchange protein DsbD